MKINNMININTPDLLCVEYKAIVPINNNAAVKNECFFESTNIATIISKTDATYVA